MLQPKPRRFRLLSRELPRFTVRRFAGHMAHSDQLEGIRVVQLTDLHFGRAEPLMVQQEAVRLANAAKPDLVVLTGDFVGHGLGHLDEIEYVLAAIEAPCIAVLGNHDHWAGALEVRRTLDRAGIEVLSNVNTVITLRHQHLQIVGVDDAYTGHADVVAATKGLRSDLPILGLSHIAEEADELWSHGVPLVLSGHTHGGQIAVARVHEAVGRWIGHRYIHGLYGTRDHHDHHDEARRGAVYVSAGIGSSVVTTRVGEPACREVSIFELGAEPGTLDEPLVIRSANPPRPSSVIRLGRRATGEV